ncbi:MAG: CDP-alcohol phosphatidyltransferase family protein [Tannerellaceae bacterium]|jgi:hypothetical protein|nr:CDP-alcohol phosphatidyltransferase family protein [Tannerellaceae bacterium]
MQDRRKKPDISATFKSLDTEEAIDLYFYRPVGYRWALLFERFGVSPNTVTVAAIFIGIVAGVCFYFRDMAVNVAGMLLLVWANTYDSADGQLARMTGKISPMGRMLDGFCGDLWFITIYAAICFRLMPQWGVWIWLLGAFTGYFHSRQAAMADYYRNIHLLFLKGKSGSELSHSAILKEEYKRLGWKKDFFYKLANVLYTHYTAGQEQWSPRFQRMMRVLRERYGDEAPGWFREAFRTKSLSLMKYANMLSFNTRIIALFAALFMDRPWLYFVFEATVLNGMLLYMTVRHERFCAAFTERLTAETAEYD